MADARLQHSEMLWPVSPAMFSTVRPDMTKAFPEA